MAEIYKHSKIEKGINEGYEVFASNCYSKGWQLVINNLGLFVGFTIVYMLISMVLGLIPFIGSLANLAISPSLIIGFYIVADKLEKGEQVTFSNFFDGFSKLGDLFIVHLVMLFFVIIGFILLVIPGIYLAVAYSFATPMVWFIYNGSVLDTLKTSRILISKNWLSFLGFYLIGLLVCILGLICLGVGIFVAIPVMYVAHYYLFMDVIGKDEEVKDDPFNQLVAE